MTRDRLVFGDVLILQWGPRRSPVENPRTRATGWEGLPSPGSCHGVASRPYKWPG